jgi:Zn-finger nucleic acid-binding protein
MFNLFNRKKLGEVTLSCPRCNTSMAKIDKDTIIIDVCPSCKGMWLDNGEVEKLANIPSVKTINKTKGEKKDGKR